MQFQWVAEHFEKVQWFLLIGIILFAWSSVNKRQVKSHFRTREADRPDLDRVLKSNKAAAKKADPLLLPGIRLSGEAHEILGVAANASLEDINKAYKDKMKLFHPDRIQGQAREQLQFYEDASVKLNQAKETMIAKFKK